MKALYVCYFGVDEPLVQTQVLPYLRGLASRGIEIHLLTFEADGWSSRPASDEVNRTEELLQSGIRWSWLPYHKRPTLPATAWDVLQGVRQIRKLHRRERFDLIHARSHVAATMALRARESGVPPILFDIRGLLADEYVDAGNWKRGGILYRLTKRAESELLRSADGFVVLTERIRTELFPDDASPVEVIPCCIDRARFDRIGTLDRDAARKRFGIPANRFVVVYAGALGGWYLTEETAELMGAFRKARSDAFALVLTQSPPGEMRRLLVDRGFGEADFLVTRVNPGDVPAALQTANVGLSLIRPCESKRASSPTKFAEYLASGIPIVSTAGIGDIDEIIAGDRVGVVLQDFGAESIRRAVEMAFEIAADPSTVQRCRQVAWSKFELETIGVERYDRLYRRVAQSHAID